MSIRLLSIVSFCLFLVASNAQQNKYLLKSDNTIENNNSMPDVSVEVPLESVTFSQDIFHFYMDSSSHKIFLSTREMNKELTHFKRNGYLATLDIATKKIDWQNKINYSKYTTDIKGRYLIRKKVTKNIMIDLLTGKELWKVKNDIAFISDRHEIAFGYRISAGNQDLKRLQGISLSDGEVVWEREVDRRFKWREIFPLSDSTVIISSSGVHQIDLRSGKGWTIEQTAGKDKFKLLSGSKRFYNLGSNIVLDSLDQNMYIAGEDIMRFDTDGNVIWKTKLPEDKLSKMFLFSQGDTLYLLNTGGANELKNYYDNIGQAYVASILKHTGEILSIKDIPLENKEYIYDVKFKSPKHIFALSKIAVRDIDLTLSKVSKRVDLNLKLFGNYKHLVKKEPFLFRNGRFDSVHEKYACGVYNEEEETYNFIPDMGKTMVFKSKDLYFKLEVNSTYDLYYGMDKQAYVVSQDGKLVAKLDVLDHPGVLNNKLYSFKGSQMNIHDLSDLMLD